MKKIFTYLIATAALMIVSAAAMAQGGASPYLNSTHTYKVTMEDGTNNSTGWVITDASGTALSPQPSFTATVNVDTAFLEITWANTWASSGTDYKIQFTETDGNSCSTIRELDISVIANTFYLSMNADAEECHDSTGLVLGTGASGPTTIYFTVNLIKDAGWSIDSWKYDFSVDIAGTYSLQSVSIDGGASLGTSGTYTDNSISGSNATSIIAVVVSGSVILGEVVTVTLSNGVAIKGTTTAPDNGTGDDAQVLTINPLPNTSDIATD